VICVNPSGTEVLILVWSLTALFRGLRLLCRLKN
jgi:hypothetical protein